MVQTYVNIRADQGCGVTVIVPRSPGFGPELEYPLNPSPVLDCTLSLELQGFAGVQFLCIFY